MVEWLFLAVPWGCLRFVIVVFPDHTHLLFLLATLIMSLILLNLVLKSSIENSESILLCQPFFVNATCLDLPFEE